MICVEGPDGAGKTTLVNHLVEKYGLTVGERGTADRSKLYEVTRRDTYNALSLALKPGEPPRIWDRLFVSEFVYADIVGRPVEFNDRDRQLIVDVMNALEFPMIVCLPPWDVVVDNVTGTDQMKGVHENLRAIYDAYDNAMLPWPENTIWYDYTNQKVIFAALQHVEEEVEGYLLQRKEREV